MSTEEALKRALEDLQEIKRIRKEGLSISVIPSMKVLKCNPSSKKSNFDLRFLNASILQKTSSK